MEDHLKHFSEIKVSDIMIKNPLFTTPYEKISKTELIMVRKNIGGLPVVDDSKNKLVIGIITQRDVRLARFAMNFETSKTIVKDLMTPEPIVVKENNTIKFVLETMFDKKIQRLPVVDEENKLIGLVLQIDILRKLLDYMKR